MPTMGRGRYVLSQGMLVRPHWVYWGQMRKLSSCAGVLICVWYCCIRILAAHSNLYTAYTRWRVFFCIQGWNNVALMRPLPERLMGRPERSMGKGARQAG